MGKPIEILPEDLLATRRATNKALWASIRAKPQDEDWRLEQFMIASRAERDLIQRFNAQFEMTAGPDPRLVGRAKNA